LFAYITDLHGNFPALPSFIQECKLRCPDLRCLLVGGDLTRKPSFSEDWEAAKNASIAEAGRLFRELALETYFILGNDDIENPPPSNLKGQNFLGMTSDVISLEGEIGLLGFSYVPPTPFLTRYERQEKILRQMLEPLFKRLAPFKFKIVMCHAPPYGTNLDITKDWLPGGNKIQVHAGSRTIRMLIEEYQPDLALFGHLHESSGSCKLGRTLCVNPGASNKNMKGCLFGFDWVEGIGEFEYER
jgi:Icc-related predicted phosphoesterase